MTLDQIEELRRGSTPSVSLQHAAGGVGLAFEQCSDCKGRGFTKATLLLSTRALHALAVACPKEPIPIQYDRCGRCRGAGGWVST